MNTSNMRTVGARFLSVQHFHAAQNRLLKWARHSALLALVGGLALGTGWALAQSSYPAVIESKSAGGEARIDVLGERYAQQRA